MHRASSIKVAEAAKVIENTQRDLNIALMNELAMIFDKIGIDTLEVLEAAGTKWNFLPFRPGLVGGHCIGVDPYYLTHKAEKLGYHPQVILAGRRINDGMGKFIAEQTVKQLIQRARRSREPTSTCSASRSRKTARTSATRESSTSCSELAVVRRQRARARPGGRPRRSAARVRHRPEVVGCAAAGARNRGRGRAQRVQAQRRPTTIVSKLDEGGLYVDVKCQADAAQFRARGVKVWRL